MDMWNAKLQYKTFDGPASYISINSYNLMCKQCSGYKFNGQLKQLVKAVVKF